MCLLACSRLSDSDREGARVWERRERVGETRKWKAHAAPPLLSFLPFLCSRFLNSAGPIISEPGTGYKSTVNAHCIFVLIGSLFLNIRLHSILNNRKKRSQRRREVVIDGRSICHSWQCFQLAFRHGHLNVTFSAQSEQFSTNVPFFQSVYY